MSEERDHFGYIAFRDSNGGTTVSLSLGRDIEALREKSAPDKGKAPSSEKADPETPDEGRISSDREGSMASTLEKTLNSSHSQSELIDMVSFMRPAYKFVVFTSEIRKPVEDKCQKVESDDTRSIFGLPEYMYRKVLVGLERLKRVEKGLEALPSAVLMSIVSTFDSGLSDVVRDLITLKPDLLKPGTKMINAGRYWTAWIGRQLQITIRSA